MEIWVFSDGLGSPPSKGNFAFQLRVTAEWLFVCDGPAAEPPRSPITKQKRNRQHNTPESKGQVRTLSSTCQVLGANGDHRESANNLRPLELANIRDQRTAG